MYVHYLLNQALAEEAFQSSSLMLCLVNVRSLTMEDAMEMKIALDPKKNVKINVLVQT